MTVYQSDYEDFYHSVMQEVNEKTRIKVFERLKRWFENKWKELKKDFEYKLCDGIKRRYYKMRGRQYYRMRPLGYSEGPTCASMDAPMRFYSEYEPKDEKISLRSYAYGKMIDDKYKRRFLASESGRSNESIYELRNEVAKNIYKQKVNSSLLLRIAVFLHLT